MTINKLSPLQLELLKVYSFNPSEADFLAIKNMLANSFAQKLVRQVKEAVVKKNITEQDLENWLNQ